MGGVRRIRPDFSSQGTACLAGGIVGGLGIGALGRWAGESIGESAYWRFVAVEWMPSR
jgi:hypothetical protein